MTTTTENTEVKKNLDWAVGVLEDLTNFIDVEEALAIVRREKPDHEILKNFKGADAQDLAGKEIAKERATKNLAAARAGEDYEKLRKIGEILGNDGIINEADDLYIEKNKEKLQKNGLNDDEALLRSWNKLEKELSGIGLNNIEDDEEIRDLTGLTRIYDDTDDEARSDKTSDTEKDDWAAFLEAVRKEVAIKMHEDADFFMKKSEDRKKVLLDEVKDMFKAKLAVAIAASNAKPFMQKLKDITPKKISAWLKSLKDGKALKDEDGKFKLFKSQLMNSTAQTALNLKEHQKSLEKRGFTKAAASVGKSFNNFFNKMKDWGKKAWEMRYAVAESVANNKNRIITTAVVGVATAVASPALLALGASAAWATGFSALSYAAYNIAGAYIWPLEEQRMKARRAALKAGDEKTAAKYKFGRRYLTKIWDMKAEMTEEQRARYLTRAAVTAGVGVLGAGLIGYGTVKAAESLSGTALDAAKVIGVDKFWARTMRALGSTSVSGWFAVQDTAKAIKTGDEQAKKNAVVAWIGAIGTGIVSAVAQVIDYERSVANNPVTETDPNANPGTKLTTKTDTLKQQKDVAPDTLGRKQVVNPDTLTQEQARKDTLELKNPTARNDSTDVRNPTAQADDHQNGAPKADETKDESGNKSTQPDVDGDTKVRTIEVGPEGSGRMVESPIEFPKEYDAKFCEEHGLTRTEWNRLVRIHHDKLEERFALFNEFFTKKVPDVIEEKDMMEEFRKFTVQEDHHTFIWEKETNKEWRGAMIAIHDYVICHDEADPNKDLNYAGVFAAVTRKNEIVGEKGTWDRLNNGVDCDRTRSVRVGRPKVAKPVVPPAKDDTNINIDEVNKKERSGSGSFGTEEVNKKVKTGSGSFSIDEVNKKVADKPMEIEAYEEGGTNMNGKGVHPNEIHPEKGEHVKKGDNVLFNGKPNPGGVYSAAEKGRGDY